MNQFAIALGNKQGLTKHLATNQKHQMVGRTKIANITSFGSMKDNIDEIMKPYSTKTLKRCEDLTIQGHLPSA